MFQGVYFSGLSDFSLLFAEALSSATTKSIADWSRLKILGFSSPNPLNIRIVSFQQRGLVGRTQDLREGQRESVDEKVDREHFSVLDFLSLTC